MKPITIRSTGTRERALLAAAGLLIALVTSIPAHAQLDPLISLKRVPPRIVIVFDTSFEMLYDANRGGTQYCDPVVYTRATDPNVAAEIGVPPTQATYRRTFNGLKIEADGSFSATSVSWSDGSVSPCAGTRLEMARAGVGLALRRSGNPRLHFGLVRLRQTTPVWRTAPSNPCSKVKVVSSAGTPVYSNFDMNPCNVGGSGWLAFNPPTNGGANSTAAAPASAYAPSAVNTAAALLANVFDKPMLQSPLIPTGVPTATADDRPLAATLDDARAEVVRAMVADGAALAPYRNTVVVLIAGGKDFTGDPVTKAANFLSVSVGGATKRVPIFVVGVSPKPDHEDQLRQIATASGGLYSKAFTPEGVERVINLALQAGCQRPADFNSGLTSEYPLVSPVIGTVNLDNAHSSTGGELQNSVIYTSTGNHIPQRNNILLTSSFALGRGSLTPSSEASNPGFEGRLRAFRAFKPVVDGSKPSGYTFTKDGTPLWPDVDGRSWLAGQARVPRDASTRNIYTYVPGYGVISFDTTNLPKFFTSLALPADKSGWGPWLIDLVRGQPLGAIISSTPAVMDPPSLDPPPDDDYGRSDAPGTYAYNHKDRRSIIFVGANDGMLHAIDARTGIEVWAFIPYNLLPKLQTIFDGQSPYEFTYFVDQSPKIAEIKMSGQWRSVLMIGEGWGGTFYQTFDVTEAGIGGPAPESDDWSGVLATFRDPDRIKYMWSFPQYEHFDPTIAPRRIAAADTTSFGRVKFFGDLSAAATIAEKKVGFTWSDPAVGSLDSARSVNAAIVGSGYFPKEAEDSSSLDKLPNRVGAGVGRTFYLINMATGLLVGNTSGSGCATSNSGTGCLDVGDAGGSRPKNALQADPTVTSDYGSYIAKKAYMGDLQGTYYRFDFNAGGAITKTALKSTGQPIYASSALMWVGSTSQYIFFATGSDMLPSSPPSAFGTGTFSMYGLKDAGGTVTDAFTKVDMAPVTNMAPENVTDVNNKLVGFPAGERPSTSPSVAGEIVFFTTTVEGTTGSAEPTYNLYAVTYSGSNGYPPVGSTDNSTKNNKSGGATAVAPVKTGSGRATAPFVVDQHLYFATSSGSNAKVEAFGDPNDFNNGVGQVGVRILSWREIRR